MPKVTISVGTDTRLARATCEHEDEAQALASCIYRIAETSPSDRVAWIGDAVYRLMRGEPTAHCTTPIGAHQHSESCRVPRSPA